MYDATSSLTGEQDWQREPTAKERKELAEREARERAQALATNDTAAELRALDWSIEDVTDPPSLTSPGSERYDEDVSG